jgi:hypothetical protein
MPEMLKAVQTIAGRYPHRDPSDLAGIRHLIEQQTPIDEPNAEGQTAFFWAVRCDLHDIAELLEQAGADASCRSDGQLLSAVFSGDGDLARLALSNGADPERKYATMTPLELATFHGNPDVVDALVRAGAHVSPDALAPLGEMDITDYMIDSDEDERRYARVVSTLIVNGASPAITAFDNEPLIESFPESRYPQIHGALSAALERANAKTRNG